MLRYNTIVVNLVMLALVASPPSVSAQSPVEETSSIIGASFEHVKSTYGEQVIEWVRKERPAQLEEGNDRFALDPNWLRNPEDPTRKDLQTEWTNARRPRIADINQFTRDLTQSLGVDRLNVSEHVSCVERKGMPDNCHLNVDTPKVIINPGMPVLRDGEALISVEWHEVTEDVWGRGQVTLKLGKNESGHWEVLERLSITRE